MKPAALLSLCGLLASCQATAQAPSGPAGGLQAGPSMAHDPQIVTTLLRLMEVKDDTRPSKDDFTQTALKDIVVLGTPAGFHLRNRYIHLGVSLAEAVSVTDDARLKDQLLEIARWERNPEIRSVGLIAMGARKEPGHLRHFQEALVNADPSIRFAALEALELWDLPEAKTEFERAARHDRSSIVRIYAAQAWLRRGGEGALDILRGELESGDWIARGMAARYLGDLGGGEDYDRLLNRMSAEQNNDFVVAEVAIAALKLFPKKK